jgi:hypothetical protein
MGWCSPRQPMPVLSRPEKRKNNPNIGIWTLSEEDVETYAINNYVGTIGVGRRYGAACHADVRYPRLPATLATRRTERSLA